MSLEKIMSVAGKPGLFRMISQTKSGFVVESLADKKKTVVNAHQRVSMLNDITVYTRAEDKPLHEILASIREKNGNTLPVDPKSEPEALRSFFKTIVPDYDEERVYVSDIKKIIAWYGLLGDLSFHPETPPGDDAGKQTQANADASPAPEDKKKEGDSDGEKNGPQEDD